MMRFNWLRFCEKNGVPFVTSGPNTASGHISITCPWCGEADQGNHMGLSLDAGAPYWGCFRNAAHRGKHPARLIARLLRLTLGAAHDLVRAEEMPLDYFEEIMSRLKNGPAPGGHAPAAAGKVLVPPAEFRPLAGATGPYSARFLSYLARRGFGAAAGDVAQLYGLWYALTGEFAWRVIFPIHDAAGNLIGWTGRDIREGAVLRYKTATGIGKPLLRFPPGYPPPAQSLVICEGPFDALKLDFYGREYGVRAVASIGTAITSKQVMEIIVAQKDAKRVWVLFDSDAVAQGLALAEELRAVGGDRVRWKRLPPGYKDAGEMSAGVAKSFCRELVGYSAKEKLK